MSLGWDTYLYQLEDGRPAAITLDLDASPEESQGLTILVRARIVLRQPAEHGLMVAEETDALAEADEAFDELVDTLSDGMGVFVGSLTMGGQCIMHAYLPGDTVIPAELNLGSYTAQVHTQDDPDWSVFLEGLYPSEDQLHCIINRRIVDQLEEDGDTVTIPREVFHSAFFPNSNGAQAFADEAATEGYRLDQMAQDPDDGSVEVRLCREEPVDLKSINETSLLLVRLAATCGGYYDGWEAATIAQPH